uniref:Uncharacterized protein n=1 Tax=Biomphalaria glabrata TaxID=6526 RepID=A0A2C9LV57_BIOGL
MDEHFAHASLYSTNFQFAGQQFDQKRAEPRHPSHIDEEPKGELGNAVIMVTSNLQRIGQRLPSTPQHELLPDRPTLQQMHYTVPQGHIPHRSEQQQEHTQETLAHQQGQFSRPTVHFAGGHFQSSPETPQP